MDSFLRCAALVTVLGLASGCVHFECKKHGGSEVRSIATEHFVVTSALPLEQHKAQAEKLELIWDTFAAFFGADVERARVPIVLLNSTDDVSYFASGYVGFVRRSGPTVLVIGAPDDDGGLGTSTHELAHLVSAFMLPRQPRWVAEGLAALFEDAKFRDARTVKMGRWNVGRAQEAFGVAMSLEELQQWQGPKNAASEGLAYASAWAWMHYLANHEEARLRRLFDGLRSERPLSVVMNDVFPAADQARLHDAVKQYLREARFRGWETSLQRTPKLEAPVVLADWEVHALRSRLFLLDARAGENDEKLAVELAPSPMPAGAAVLKAELAREKLEPLLKVYPDSPDVLRAVYVNQDSVPPRASIEAALAKQPDDVELIWIAARAAWASGENAAAEKHVQHGLALAPWSTDLTILALQFDLTEGRCDEADRDWAQLLSLLPERGDAASKSMKGMLKLVQECRVN